MRKLAFFIILLIFLTPVKADVIHRINLSSGKLIINSTLILKSKEAIDYWDVSLPLQKDTKIIEIKDDVGEIKNYNFSDGLLIFKTNPKKSKIRIVNLIYSEAIKQKYGLKFASLSLFGFSGENTTIISQNFPYFFVSNAKIEYGKIIKARGKGPLNVKILFGGKKQSEHYFTNSNLNLSEIEKYYWVVEGVTGLKVPVKFGIVVLSGSEYEGELEYWSAGSFEDGLIIVRKESKEKDKIATIMHETTHGFNSFALDWDKSNTTWFDEGVATFVTSVIYRLLNKTMPQIFGEEISWKKGNIIYSLEPIETPEDLWRYYVNNESFMLSWNPRKYSDERRRFGYAYSELFIIEYLKDNATALHRVYKELLKIDKSIYSEKDKSKIMQKILGKEFKPCYSKNLEEIKNCTRELNEMDFRIPRGRGMEVNYEVKIPKLPEEAQVEIPNSINPLLKQIVDFFNSLIQQILSFLKW